jgi:hypothetical protein
MHTGFVMTRLRTTVPIKVYIVESIRGLRRRAGASP